MLIQRSGYCNGITRSLPAPKLLELCTVIGLMIFLTYQNARAQIMFAEIPLGKSSMSDYDVIAFGDSVLFSFEEQTTTAPIIHKRWVCKQKISADINVPGVVSMVDLTNGQLYYYGFEKTKSSILVKGYRTRSDGVIETLEPLSLPEGILVGSYIAGDRIVMVLYQRDLNFISVHEIEHMKVVAERKYPVPSELRIWIRRESDVNFMEQSSPHINTFKGYSRVKLIHENDLYLSLDNHMHNETMVIILRQDKDTIEQIKLQIDTYDDFGSYILNNKLFVSILSNKKFQLRVYDLLTQKLLATKVIEKGSETFDVFLRVARYNTIQKETLGAMMRGGAMGNPQLSVRRDSNNYVIAWGNFIDDNGAGGPVGGNPLAMMMTMLVSTAIKQMSDGPGISWYFFYRFDEKDLTFSYPSNGASAPRTKLDNYELEQMQEGEKVKSKSYLAFKNGLMGIYALPKRKVVQMITFE